MAALPRKPLAAEPVRPVGPFLRKWSLENPQLATCAVHDHLALIYENQADQLDVVIPFLRLGMERNEKSIYIVDDNSPETVVAGMERHGIDVAGATASGALAIVTKHDAYLKNGDFDPDWMISFLVQAVADAKEEGFAGVRTSGEMTWALGPAGDAHSRLIEYECKLNTFFPHHNMGSICQYNLRRFRSDTLMHVVRTHPRLVFRHQVCDNPYYLAPELYQGTGAGMDQAVRRLLEGMVENARLRRHLNAETAALRQSERRYRELLQALECIATGRPLDDCLGELTAAVTRLSPTTRAAVFLADSSGDRVERAISSSFPASLGDALEGTPLRKPGGCGLAMFERRPITSADISVDERWSKGWRELWLAHGVIACHSAPVISSDGKALGAVFLGFSTPRWPDEIELAAAGFCARAAGIAIDRELAQERQRASEAALRRSEQLAAAGRMAATIAHEINNPLEAVTNLCFLLGEQDLPPTARDFVTMMGGELNRVSHISKQTLEFYRLGRSAGQVDLAEQIDQAALLFTRAAQSRNSAIEVRHCAPSALHGFAGELRQLFVNLIGNALEAGAAKVRIRTSPGRDWRQPGRRGVRILIVDNGGGIPPTAAPKVFEPFFTTKEEKGTGLGLWVSKGIVQKHEGSIAMRTSTRPGQSGTVFSIFLPTA